MEESAREEIDGIVKMFKNNKAPGGNAVTAEMLKVCGGETRRMMYRMVNKV